MAIIRFFEYYKLITAAQLCLLSYACYAKNVFWSDYFVGHELEL